MRAPLLVLSLILLSCGGPSAERRTFPVEVSVSPGTLVTDSGWAVSLDAAMAELATGRFFEGKAVARAPWWRRAPALVWGTAWAHPGHYVPGEALAEVLAPMTVDLLAGGPQAWGEASGVTGAYGSFQLTFGAGGVWLEGRATRGGEVVPFEARFVPSAPLEGVSFEHALTTAEGRVGLELRLTTWLSRIDFSQVGASAEPLDAASPAFNGLARGVMDTSAYSLLWKEN